MKKALFIIVFGLIYISCQLRQEQAKRPNILLIVADDLGYSDLGCYGGEIRTPNIDALAVSGIRFSQFHTSPYCAPTRAMLLSGQNNHVAGMGTQGGAAPGSSLYGIQGYEGYLSERVIPISQLLKEAGYHTCMAGKWHLGNEAEHSPAYKGFEKSFCLLQGGSNHFNAGGLEPDDSVSLFRENEYLVDYPEGEYSTELYTNKLIKYISEINDDRPFFAFAAYTSPHWPLQVPDEYLNKYEGKYSIGYDSLRILRFNGLKKAGVIPKNSVLPPRLESIRPWNDLNEEGKMIEARKMELYAAMVENLDYHVGRLIQFLKDKGLYENTFIVFMADNGAAGEDFYNTTYRKEFLQAKYDNSLENMGKATSWVSYGPQWAQAGVAAFNRYKSYTTEGGITAPLIISGATVTPAREFFNSYVTLLDLAPTFYELAGVSFPQETPSSKIIALPGRSIIPYLQSETDFVHDENYFTALEHRGRVFARKGDWKLVQLDGPYDESKMMLFNLRDDPAEITNLKEKYPEKFEELLNEWNAYIEANEIHIIK